MVVSIQSHVAYGHVGNRAAVFPLERMGIEVIPINTVQFSNHPGYGSWKGSLFTGMHIRELWEGLEAIGVVKDCGAILSGYIGSPEVGTAIINIVETLRVSRPQALFCCDPVMGDYERGLYVHKDIPGFFRQEALPAATILKPNQFEAEILSGIRIVDVESARAACTVLHERGPSIIIMTSVDALPVPGDQICSVLSLGGTAFMVRTPRFFFPVAPHGAGDLACALFLGYFMDSGDAMSSFEKMMTAVYRVFELTDRTKSRELAILGAQDAFVSGERRFSAEKLW